MAIVCSYQATVGRSAIGARPELIVDAVTGRASPLVVIPAIIGISERIEG